jgi:hypothetical protein
LKPGLEGMWKLNDVITKGLFSTRSLGDEFSRKEKDKNILRVSIYTVPKFR